MTNHEQLGCLPPHGQLASPARGGVEKTACGLQDGGVDKEVSQLHRCFSLIRFAKQIDGEMLRICDRVVNR